MTNIEFFDRSSTRRVREDQGDYDTDAVEHAMDLYEAQGLIDLALNFVGLLLAAVEDASDERSVQTHAAALVIKNNLERAHKRLDEHEAKHVKLFCAHAGLRNRIGEPEPDDG